MVKVFAQMRKNKKVQNDPVLQVKADEQRDVTESVAKQHFQAARATRIMNARLQPEGNTARDKRGEKVLWEI